MSEIKDEFGVLEEELNALTLLRDMHDSPQKLGFDLYKHFIIKVSKTETIELSPIHVNKVKIVLLHLNLIKPVKGKEETHFNLTLEGLRIASIHDFIRRKRTFEQLFAKL